MLGGGEYNRMTRSLSYGAAPMQPTVMKMDFDVFS
jgi:hypothetical protein